MIIFVDGCQGVGKSLLVDNCKYKHKRFPFNEYLDKFNLDLNTYQLSKDLGMLFGLQFTEENIVFDRGPISTVYYSLKENRYKEKTMEIILEFLKEISKYKNCAFIFVKKINNFSPIKRIRNDGFDYLNDEEDPNKEILLDEVLFLAKYAGINIYIFENDFSKKLKVNYHNFNNLLEKIINEYNRN